MISPEKKEITLKAFLGTLSGRKIWWNLTQHSIGKIHDIVEPTINTYMYIVEPALVGG